MICPHCGKTLEDNTKFCPWCGRPTSAPAPTGTAGAPREKIAAAPAAPRMGPPLPPETSTPSAPEVPDPAQRSTHTRTGLVVGVIVVVALALVAALSLLPRLLDSTRWSGPSLTISSPPSQESDATRSSATGTYYAFWNDGESIVSYTYVLDEDGTGSLLLAGYDAMDQIAQDDVDENEDSEGLRWDVDDDLVSLSSAPGEPTLPDGDVSYELDGRRGSRVLSPTSYSPFPHETFYEDFGEALENMSFSSAS